MPELTGVATTASINAVRTCTNCRNRVAQTVPVCPFCGARMDSGAPGTLGGLTAERVAQNVVIGEVVKSSSHRVTFGIASIVITALALGLYLMRPSYFPVAAVESPQSAVLCDQAERCLVAYLSPWDPASARTYKLIDEISEALPSDVALDVVWGVGHPTDLDAMAAQSGERAFIDPSDSIVKHFDLKTVPAWFLLDNQARAVETMQGTYVPIEYHLSKLGLGTYGPR